MAQSFEFDQDLSEHLTLAKLAIGYQRKSGSIAATDSLLLAAELADRPEQTSAAA